MNFNKLFLRESKTMQSNAAKITLAVFGKHPAWDDHIDDFSINNDTLAILKRILYLSAIAENINSGIWETKDGNSFEKFDNYIVCRRKKEFILIKIWASKDGKGRDKYPLIACLHCVGISEESNSKYLFEVLDEIELKTKEFTSKEDVVSYFNSTQKVLDEKLFAGDFTSMDTLIEEVTLVFDKDIFESFIYLILKSNVLDKEESNCISFRLENNKDDICFYEELLSKIFPDNAVFSLTRRNCGFVDIIVGCPTPKAFAALKLKELALPISTNFKLPLSDDFKLKCDCLYEKLLNGELFSKDEIYELFDIKSQKAVKPVEEKIDYKEIVLSTFKKHKMQLLSLVLSVFFIFFIVLFATKYISSDNVKEEEVVYQVDIAKKDEITKMPMELVWSSLKSHITNWVKPIKENLKDKETFDTLSRNKDINDKLLNSFSYVEKKYNNFDLSELMEFGDNVDISYMMENPGNSIKKADKSKKLCELLEIILSMQDFCNSWSLNDDISKNIEQLSAYKLNAISEKATMDLSSISALKDSNWVEYATKSILLSSDTREVIALFVEYENKEQELRHCKDPTLPCILEYYNGKLSKQALLSDVKETLQSNLKDFEKALGFYKNDFLAHIDIDAFKASSEYISENELSLDERIAQVEKYFKLAKNPLKEIDILAFESKAEENYAILSNLGYLEEIKAFKEKFTSINKDYTSAQAIAEILKNKEDLSLKTKEIQSKIDALDFDINDFIVKNTDIELWAKNATEESLGKDKVLNKLWAERLDAYIKALDFSELKDNHKKRIQVIENYKTMREFYLSFFSYLDKNQFTCQNDNGDFTSLDIAKFYQKNKRELLLGYIKKSTLDYADLEIKLNSLNKNADILNDNLARYFNKVQACSFSLEDINAMKSDSELMGILNNSNVAESKTILSAMLDFENVLKLSDYNSCISFIDSNKILPAKLYALSKAFEYFEDKDIFKSLPDLDSKLSKISEDLKLKGVDVEGIEGEYRLKISQLWNGFYLKTLNADTKDRRKKLWEILDLAKDLNIELSKSSSPSINLELYLKEASLGVKEIKTVKDFELKLNSLFESLQSDTKLSENKEISTYVNKLKAMNVEDMWSPNANELAKVGPAKSAWVLSQNKADDISNITYTKGDLSLDFILFRKVGMKSFYIQKEEVSIALFFDTLFGSENKDAILTKLPDWKNQDFDDVRGIVTWLLAKDNLSYKLRKSWITDESYFEENEDPMPNKNMPMTWVSAELAKEFVELLSCRLPTKEEFALCLLSDMATKNLNLRDISWEKNLAVFEKNNIGNLDQRWADEGIFSSDIDFPIMSDAVKSIDADDGYIWLSPVNRGDGGLLDIVGNVWEYVSSENNTYLMGGSALSPRELPVNKAYSVDDTSVAWADVGFRLCFTSPNEELSQIFMNIIYSEFPFYK